MGVPCVRGPREAGEETRQRLAEAYLATTAMSSRLSTGSCTSATDPTAVPSDFTVVEADPPVREGQTMPADALDFDPSYERIGDDASVDEECGDPDDAGAIWVRTCTCERYFERSGFVTVAFGAFAPIPEGYELTHRESASFDLDLAEVYVRRGWRRNAIASPSRSAKASRPRLSAGVGPFASVRQTRGELVGTDIAETAIESLQANRRVTVSLTADGYRGDVREVAGESRTGPTAS